MSVQFLTNTETWHSKVRAKRLKTFAKSFGLPIVQSAIAIVPLTYTTLSEHSSTILPLINKLVLTISSYSEWPLTFTTLRMIVSSLG